ncbi:hypothetical protein LDENG_00112240 [Lucifuga dentata]|nr:hypothetical protein LDENG_00112240 [Lucifuga dentata]
MKVLLGLAVLLGTVGVLHCGPEDQPKAISENILTQLSLDGEKLVDEEVRRALYGVKQMKEVMWRNEQKHECLMKSLQHSSDKKKVENFFHRVSRRFGPRETPVNAADILVNQNPNSTDTEIIYIKKSFNQLMSKVGTLVNRSRVLVSRMNSKLDKVLQNTFLNQIGVLVEEPTSDPYYPARFLQGVSLEEVLDSSFDFGRSVVEEFGAVVTQEFDDLHGAVEEAKKKARQSIPQFLENRKLCRNLRKQTSECWQLQNQCEACQGALLTECPSVQELHVELDEVSQLLDVSKEQYEEILSIVQHHTNETVSWLSNMAAEFSWVAEIVSNDNASVNVFNINMVVPKSHDGDDASVTETEVEVNILNSPPLTFYVPGELELQDPAFIQFVAQEALDQYKQIVR